MMVRGQTALTKLERTPRLICTCRGSSNTGTMLRGLQASVSMSSCYPSSLLALPPFVLDGFYKRLSCTKPPCTEIKMEVHSPPIECPKIDTLDRSYTLAQPGSNGDGRFMEAGGEGTRWASRTPLTRPRFASLSTLGISLTTKSYML